MVFSRFPQSDFEHPLLFPAVRGGREKLDLTGRGEGPRRSKAQSRYSPQPPYIQDIEGHLASVLGDCLSRCLFTSNRETSPKSE